MRKVCTAQTRLTDVAVKPHTLVPRCGGAHKSAQFYNPSYVANCHHRGRAPRASVLPATVAAPAIVFFSAVERIYSICHSMQLLYGGMPVLVFATCTLSCLFYRTK